MNKTDAIQTKKVLINGHNIFFRYRPGTSNVFISFLHGYPTSSLDYANLISRIPVKYNVIAHDHLGFGQSDKPIDNDYLLSFQADIICSLFKTLGINKVHIVAHDYGTSVATEIIARHIASLLDFEIASMTLCNGSMLIEMAELRIIQRLLKSKMFGNVVAQLSTSSTFHRNMRNIWFDKSLYRKAEMHEHWDLLIKNNGKKVLPIITRYIDQRYTFYDRWIGALRESHLPYHILWANDDPVAIAPMADKLDSMIQNSKLSIIKDCGHYPMLEKEEEWTNHVVKFIEDQFQ